MLLMVRPGRRGLRIDAECSVMLAHTLRLSETRHSVNVESQAHAHSGASQETPAGMPCHLGL